MPYWLCAGRIMQRVAATIVYTATATTAAAVPVGEVTVIAAVAAAAAIADIVEGPTHLLGRGYTYAG